MNILFIYLLFIIRLLKDCGLPKAAIETTWSITNDSYCTDLSLLYPPYIIAIACIYLASFMSQIDLNDWFAELNVDMKDVCCIYLCTVCLVVLDVFFFKTIAPFSFLLLSYFQVWFAVNELLDFYDLWKREKPDSLKEILAKLPNFKKYIQESNPNMSIPPAGATNAGVNPNNPSGKPQRIVID